MSCGRSSEYALFSYLEYYAKYPMVLCVQVSTCAEVAYTWFWDLTLVLILISFLPWDWFRMALEYPLKRWSTLSFGWFSEYSQLVNSGTRKSVFNHTDSIAVTIRNDVVWIYCII